MAAVIFNFVDNKHFYIKISFLVLGLMLVFLGQNVLPYLNDKNVSDVWSNISFFVGIGILISLLFFTKK